MKFVPIVAVVLCVAASAWAQDRAALVQRVQQASARANAPGLSAGDRVQALEGAIEARDTLMRALPIDAHRPIWLLDQAADTLTLQTLAMADARLVVGVLNRWERADVLAAAEAAYTMAETAGGLIDDRFERHRSILEAGGELAEGDRALNRRLAETERAVRGPLLMGRAMALQVAGGGDVADPRKVVELLDGLRVGSDAARAIRDHALAIALVEIGGTENTNRAHAVLRGILVESPDEAGSLALAEVALLLGRLARSVDARAQALAEAADRTPFVDQRGLRDPALLVLAVEARARVLAEGGQLESAARTLIGIEDRRDLGGTSRQWAALADDRLASLAYGAAEWGAVAPDVTLRASRAMVAQNRPELDARAMEMLAALLDRFDADRKQASEAGELWTEPIERAPAMELLARLRLATAETIADETQASEQRQQAVVLVWRLIDAIDADLAALLPQAATLSLGPVGDRLEGRQRRELLEAALERGPDHAQADRWRLGLAAILIESGADWSRALDLADAAMRSPDSATREDATALAGAAHVLLVTRAVDEDRASLATLRRALAFVRAHPSATSLDARSLGVRIARVLIETGQREDAAEAIAAIRGVAGKDALVLRARALDQMGSPDDAFAAYREASQLVTPQADGRTYWLVRTRLLELLDAERKRRVLEQGPQAGEPLEANIRTQLLQLKAVDADLGGSPWSDRLGAIEAGLNG